MASYTVKSGDSWASIAGAAYGNQRWLLELANANGGVNRMLHPGDVVDLPDFDLSQTPVITNSQWAGVPTGVSGGEVQYGNSGNAPTVPSFAPPAVPAFGAGPTTGKARGSVSPTLGVSEADRARNYAKPYDANAVAGISRGSAMDAQLRTPIRGQSFAADRMAGIPSAARPTPANATSTNPSALSNRTLAGNRMTQGRSFAEQFANTHGMTSDVFHGRTQAGGGATSAGSNSGLTRGQQADAARLTGQASAIQSGSYNAAVPGPAPTPMSDMALIAWAARYTGLGFYEYGKTGNRNQLPNRINARVAAELPFRGAGYNSIEEFLAALGYRQDVDGNWTRYDPKVVTSYRPQTTSAAPASSGGGRGGGGLTRGPAAAQGYGPAGQLINWRLTG